MSELLEVMRSPGFNSRVEQQLDRILESSMFQTSRRRSDLLRWSVERVLGGDDSPVKEHQIGVEVFGKPESWDPRVDPVVRVEFNRLRQKLREFYEGDGGGDTILIEFPPRSYVPVFRGRQPLPEVKLIAPEPVEVLPAPPAPPAPSPPPPQATSTTHGSRWLWLVPGLLALGVLWFLVGFWRSAVSAPRASSIAVLPFTETSGAADDYLGYGFAGEITSKLTRGTTLRLTPAASAARFKNRRKDVRQIGNALQVGAIVEGTISRTGSKVHVSAQVDRASDGARLWSGSYDREMKDIVRLEDQVSNDVSTALRVKFRSQEDAEPPVALDASVHDEYLRGVYETQKGTPQSLLTASSIFTHIVSEAPRLAQPWIALGRVHLDMASYTNETAKEELTVAKTDLEKAIELDPGAAQAYADLAYVNYVLDWNWDMAETHFRQAIGLNPNSDVHAMYGYGLMTRGRFDEANTHFRGAIERDALNEATRLNFVNVLNEEGRSNEAMEQVRFCLDRDPHWFPAQLLASYTDIYAHRPQDALAHLAEADKLAPGNPLILSATAAAYAESGRKADAEALVDRIEHGGSGYTRYHLAIVEGLAGNADRVFYWLEKSADLREQQALYIKVEPLLAPYRNDPRMIALERRIGLS